MATKADFDHEIAALRGFVAAAGAQMHFDAATRALYSRSIDAMAREMEAQVRAGRMSWDEAAKAANQQRNLIMELMRGRSSALGQAMARDMKATGLTLNEIIGKKTADLYPNRSWESLTKVQREGVYRAVVESAGRSNAKVNMQMRVAGAAGRALIVLSVGIAIYNIAEAEDKPRAAAREGATLLGGIGGGAAGGAVAGLVCGPGAPVCSTVGAFIGAIAGAFGARLLF